MTAGQGKIGGVPLVGTAFNLINNRFAVILPYQRLLPQLYI